MNYTQNVPFIESQARKNHKTIDEYLQSCEKIYTVKDDFNIHAINICMNFHKYALRIGKFANSPYNIVVKCCEYNYIIDHLDEAHEFIIQCKFCNLSIYSRWERDSLKLQFENENTEKCLTDLQDNEFRYQKIDKNIIRML